MLAFADIDFHRNTSYVAMRIGLGFHQDYRDKNFYYLHGRHIPAVDVSSDDISFPQRLVFFELMNAAWRGGVWGAVVVMVVAVVGGVW